jgi:hypothetical protein
MRRTEEQIQNCLVSELRNMISEHQLGTLTEKLIYNYFRNFLCDSGVDSRITVNVLEQFGELGKEEARNIKISEGW